MKASEMIKVLQAAIVKFGDAKVTLHGNYGTTGGDEFRLARDDEFAGVCVATCDMGHAHETRQIHIMTDLGD